MNITHKKVGRPPTGQKPVRGYRLDDEENKRVKEFIKKMRQKKKGWQYWSGAVVAVNGSDIINK